MIRIKRWKLRLLLAVFALLLLGTAADARAEGSQENRKRVIAFGADLSEKQKEEVLRLLDLTQRDLADCKVITITNEMEHTYLDGYLDEKVIGTRALSSVLLEPVEEGDGVTVETHNINYCTTGMYRNALLTAGLQNTKVTVVAPTPLSGTAALIGAVKAYEAQEDTSISDAAMDTAMQELITTGEIEESAGADDGRIEELIAYLKARIASGELSSDADIQKAIGEAQEKFDVSLSADQIKKISDMLGKISDLGLDMDVLAKQAKDLYDKFGADFLNNPGEVITEKTENMVSGFFSNLFGSIKDFFSNLFS